MKNTSEKCELRALEGITILDLTYLIPGGYCTRILADHGARVIKIARPGDLFEMIDIWPWGDDEASIKKRAMAGRYFQVDCNKESFTLDYTTEKGKKILMKLIRRADVLVEGFRAGIMDRYGLSYSELSKINPNLIYCSITGYGQEGPYAHLPSHDPNIQAMGGVMALTKGEDGPGLPGIPFADILAGSNAAIAILMALIAREKGYAPGQHIDISMLDSVVWAVGATRADAYIATGTHLEPASRPLHIYKTLDEEFICLVVLEQKFWHALCSRLGLDEYIGDWRTVSPFSEENPRRQEIVNRLAQIFKRRSRWEWFELLSDYCVTPVLKLDETLRDAETRSTELVVRLNDSILGSLVYMGAPFRMSKTQGKVRRVAPTRGEHTKKILSQLSCGGSE